LNNWAFLRYSYSDKSEEADCIRLSKPIVNLIQIVKTPDPTKHVAAALLTALCFAARKHRNQRRKDSDATPYINHPIAVTDVLVRIGKVTDLATLQAGILHDTIEDTQTTAEELHERFGQAVRLLVQEVTDDKSLPKQERKRLQIEHAPHLSTAAKQIKIADKICNLDDITSTQPVDWPLQRKRDYLDWAEKVVTGCRGCNRHLEERFDMVLEEKRDSLGQAA
jgi:guanosine-3',5'-bis(diphosphate) 3'-pyrophosphohydrolase